MYSALLRSFTVYADAAKDDIKSQPYGDGEKGASDSQHASLAGDEKKEAEGAEADEAGEEPEDIHPTLREECSGSTKCIGFKKHFDHCQEKVEAGEGFKGEDCVEEL